MQKSWIIGGFIALVVIGGGLAWLIINRTVTNTPASSSSSTTTTDNSSTTTTSSVTDMTSSMSVAVTIKDMAFQPASIKIKKGTKVTWTNQDSIMHAAAADSTNPAGLPTTNELLAKGGTYSFTFNTVGTIPYHCPAHPSTMTGNIEVVE